MVDDADKQRGLATVGETARDDTSSNPLALLDQVVQIEHERIQSQNRRTEVALHAVDASDAADKRQYDFHLRQLESNERLAKARLSLGSRIALGVGLIVSVFLLAILYMTFFGSEAQAGQARQLLVWAFTAVAGGGLLMAIQRSIQWLLKHRG